MNSTRNTLVRLAQTCKTLTGVSTEDSVWATRLQKILDFCPLPLPVHDIRQKSQTILKHWYPEALDQESINTLFNPYLSELPNGVVCPSTLSQQGSFEFTKDVLLLVHWSKQLTEGGILLSSNTQCPYYPFLLPISNYDGNSPNPLLSHPQRFLDAVGFMNHKGLEYSVNVHYIKINSSARMFHILATGQCFLEGNDDFDDPTMQNVFKEILHETQLIHPISSSNPSLDALCLSVCAKDIVVVQFWIVFQMSENYVGGFISAKGLY